MPHNNKATTFLRVHRAMGLVTFAVLVLATVPLLGQLGQRRARVQQRPVPVEQPRDRVERPRGPADQSSGRVDARRPSMSRPTAPADCRGAEHGADHGSQQSTNVVDEQMVQFCNMLSRSEASHTAVASGAWSSPSTWSGRLPGPDAKVLIPAGTTVTVDRELNVPLFWVRVEGVLRFGTETNTAIVLDTLKVEPSGRLEIGTAAKPISAITTARVVIRARDGKPIDQSTDPLELSRGVIAHGMVEIHGATKTPFVSVSAMPKAGTPTIVVDQAPTGWVPGDTLVLTATEYDQDETFKLVRVEGTKLTLDHPIRNQRVLPVVEDAPGWPKPTLHLGNFTRNVQIKSDAEYAGDPKLQGHFMLMHSAGSRISWVGFYDMGRTTIKPVTDPTVHGGQRESGLSPSAGLTTENIRGRYSLHFHGAGPTREHSQVEGCAIEVKRGAGFKIGIANHSSNVSVRGCVSHNIDGSHYFTEEGDELGQIIGSLAIHSVGSGDTHDAQPRDVALRIDPQLYQTRRLDVGHRGTGFWLNGGGVDVIDNVSAGQAHSGFHLWTRGLHFRLTNTYQVRFPVANLRDRSWASSVESLPIAEVPIRFVGNTAYVLARTRYRGEGGFVFEYHGISVKSRFPNAPYSQLHNLLSWNASGLKTTYTGNLHLKNVRIIGDFSNDLGARLGTQGGNNDLIENFRVDGFLRGMALPSHSVVSGGFFGALIGIPIGSAQGTTIDLKDMKFGTVPSTLDRSGSRGRAVVAGQIQYDLYAPPIFTGRDFNPSTAFAARPPTYVRSHPNFPQGAELYSLEQMPDFVLPDFGIPGLLDGKTTTREAWETHRLVPGGGMAPPGTVPFPRSNVLVGAPTQRDSSVPARAARREAQGRVAGQYQGTVSAQPERTREQRSAERAARRPVQDSGGRPVQDPAAATRRSRTNRQNPPSEVARGAPETRNSAGNTLSASTGQTWTLVPQAGGRSLLVANGQRPRLPLVDAGTDQRVMLAEGAALQGVVATGASSHWSRAYGPGTVAFADPNNPQTRAKFSAPGTYVLHLTVQDQASLKNTAPVTITVMQSP